MNYLLLIHTSLDKAFVAISGDNRILGVKKNAIPKEHGSFLHVAIEELLKEQNLLSTELAAIGITNGPGSYTGIRVGLSAAKGLGFALNIPLVVCSTLLALAATAAEKFNKEDAIYIPMIHARQSEYYVGWYDLSLKELRNSALVRVDAKEMAPRWHKKEIHFGIGLEYFAKASGSNELIGIDEIDPSAYAQVTWDLFRQDRLTKADSAGPLYLKDAFVTIPKSF